MTGELCVEFDFIFLNGTININICIYIEYLRQRQNKYFTANFKDISVPARMKQFVLINNSFDSDTDC